MCLHCCSRCCKVFVQGGVGASACSCTWAQPASIWSCLIRFELSGACPKLGGHAWSRASWDTCCACVQRTLAGPSTSTSSRSSTCPLRRTPTPCSSGAWAGERSRVWEARQRMCMGAEHAGRHEGMQALHAPLLTHARHPAAASRAQAPAAPGLVHAGEVREAADGRD